MESSLSTKSGKRKPVRLLMAVGGLFLATVPVVVWAQASRPAATRPADRSPQDVQREYQQRFNQLKADDIQGHYQLAEWCRDQKAYRLLLRQSKYVLSLDGNHENARLLYRIAVERLKQQVAQTRPADGQPAAQSADGEFLTPAQIQKLRWAEFLPEPEARAEPMPEAARRAAIPEERFRVRISRDVINDFLDQMAGDRDFDERAERTAFLQLSATRQVQAIRKYTGDKFQNSIEITNDPVVFHQFQQVLPLIMNGCGTIGCHGGPEAQGWRLRTARPRTDLNLYTNWLIVNSVQRNKLPLVNRNKPEDSLLLQYALPPEQAIYRHPEEIPIIFTTGRRDVRYRQILTWIEMLTVPAPRTGVSLAGYREPGPPQIGGTAEQPKPAPAQNPAPAPAPTTK